MVITRDQPTHVCIVCNRDMWFHDGHRDAQMCSVKCRNKKKNRLARGWPIADKDQGPWMRVAKNQGQQV